MSWRAKNEEVAASLSEIIKVNPLGKAKNKPNAKDTRLKKETKPKLVKSSKSFQVVKEKNQVPMKSIMFGVEQHYRASTVKKKSSTLDLIERLKKIEAREEKLNFLEQANEEIDIASKQIEEIRKMIERKFEKEAELKSRYFYGEESNESKQEKRSSIVDRCSKQFERMQKSYLNKTKIRFRSLQDVENMTLERKNCEELAQKRNEKSRSVDLFSKDLETAGPILKKQMSLILKKQNSAMKNENFYKQPTLISKSKTSKVRFKEESCLKSDYCSSASDDDLCPSLQDEDVRRILMDEDDKERYPTNKKTQDECVQAGDVIKIFSKKDDSVLSHEFSQSGKNKLNLLLNGDETEKNQLDDAKLEENVLKSAYLSLEFSRQCNKTGDKSSTQLLESVMHKFHPRQASNSLGRDLKLYSSLDSALKDTLYTQIQK